MITLEMIRRNILLRGILVGFEVNISTQGQGNTVALTRPHPLEPFFHPQPLRAPSPEYEEFMRVRQRILDVIRNESPEKKRVIADLVDVLIEYEVNIPSNPLSVLLSAFHIVKKVRSKRQRRELYTKIIVSLLEKLFDPGLEFKMRKKDILDTFDANDLDRDRVSNPQILQIYVRVIHKLEVGELRDLTYEEQLNRYVRLKLEEIKLSRQDWELNGR